MRKSIIALIFAVLCAGALSAGGNAEKLATIEGTLVIVPGADGGAAVMLRTETGDEIVVEMPQAELARMRLREEARVAVKGVYVGVPRGAAGAQVRARILARIVSVEGQTFTVEDPVALTDQDRQRIREWERDQTRLRAQTQERVGTSSGTGTSEGSGEQAGRK